MTPMLKQYFDLKKTCPDAILFFRMGDFYEVFGDDALKVAPILNIILTNRNREEKMPFCGVPHHSYKPYCQKLLSNGFKVAIAEQMQATTGKGILRRKIVNILSPGLQDDVDVLVSDKPNYLACLYEDPSSHRWALLLADVSTGELRCGEFDTFVQALAFLKNSEPTEMLLRAFQHEFMRAQWGQAVPHISTLPEDSIADDCERQVLKLFPPQALQTLTTIAQKKCLAGFIAYMQKSFRALDCFLSVRPLTSAQEMTLAANVVRDLELFATTQHSSQGSLYRLLNKTCTPMGARRLRYCLLHPLLDTELLKKRKRRVQRQVQQGIEAITKLREQLKGCIDLERVGNLILSRRIQPSQVYAIALALDKALALGAAVDVSRVKELSALIQQTFKVDAGQLGMGVEVFVAACDAALAQAMQLATHGEERIKDYERQLRVETGIISLRIRKHKSMGLLIEITRANLAKVPATFTLAQTMQNISRYRTADLQELEQKLAAATIQAINREEQLYREFLDKLQDYHVLVMQVSAALAEIDLHQSYAFTAIKENYCAVEIADCVELQASRHPVVEKMTDEFVANDILLGGKESKIILLTGANMAGKSTAMRQVALAALMHQAGMHIPARQAKLPVFDQVFTRVGASDNISAGQSTFMVEMSETALILRLATQHSLVIVDEVGRGTSTADGLALAQAIFENLVGVGCYCFFATHFHELLPAVSQQTKVRAMQIAVRDGCVFTHQLTDGAASKSFGIEVARQAGIPPVVLHKAKELLRTPVKAEETVSGGATNDSDKVANLTSGERQLLQDLRERLTRVDLHRTTPLQALNLIGELQGELTYQQPALF